MDEANYQKALDAATKELADVMEQVEEIEELREKALRRIYALRDGIYGLSALLGQDPLQVSPELFVKCLEPDTGFTDAIRKVLEINQERYMTPVSVRDQLKEIGFDLSKYTNPLASIHTILKRLVVSKEVEKSSGVGDRTIYRWKKPTDKPANLYRAGMTYQAASAMGELVRSVAQLNTKLIQSGVPSNNTQKFIEDVEERMKKT